jgi:hypothetical protein
VVFLGGFFLLPTLPQGAGREGAGAPPRRSREEHQSRQGGGGSVINWTPGSGSVILLLRTRGPDPEQDFRKKLKI